jgi:tetratricopeptide (TPR) repeat protein
VTFIHYYGFTSRLIWGLIAVALITSIGCGSRQMTPQGPPVDKNLERTKRAARTAFENGRIQQAANLYRQTLERANLRDDLAAAVDARYNLALCLTLLQSDQEAFEMVIQAREELARIDQPVPTDILLLEATILYRLGKSQEAWQLTEDILTVVDTIPPAVQSKTHYLRGLIANDRGDLVKLSEEITALAKSNSPVIRADREELIGHLSLAKRKWDEAVLAFDEAAALRRQVLDYQGMVKALAKAGKACEQAGRLLPASWRYLRAGQSAALQGRSAQARSWLTWAAQLAEQGGDQNIAREARQQLAQLQKDRPAAPVEYDAGRDNSR